LVPALTLVAPAITVAPLASVPVKGRRAGGALVAASPPSP